MSMTLAFSIPGIAVVAAERNVTITDATGECILEGCRKLVELSNGFAVGAGPIAGASAALAAMSGGGPVTPTRFNECADAADMLYPQGGIQLAAIVNTPEGVRILKSAAVDGVHRQTRRRQVIEFGWTLAAPFDDDGMVQGMAADACNECARLGDVTAIVARIARFFADAAKHSPYVSQTVDIGVLTPSRRYYFTGASDELSVAERLPAHSTRPQSLSAALVYASPEAGRLVTGICGPDVDQVFVYSRLVGFGESTAGTEHEDHLVTVLTPDANRKVSYTFDVPPEGSKRNVVFRPYGVSDGGHWTAGPARVVDIDPAVRVQPIVDSDDHETATHGYFWIRLQDRGLALTGITYGRQTSPSNIVQGLAPTRGPGDASAVKGGTLGEGEYEAEVALPQGWQSWLWFDLVFEGVHSMRVMSPPLGPNRTPAFVGLVPIVTGTVIHIHGDNVRSVRVERKTGATWQVDRDTTLPIGIDVAQQDDSGNPGLSSGTGAFLITIYSDPVSQRDGNTLTDAQSVNVTAAGGSATYSIDIMTVSAPAIEDTSGSVSYKASSSTPKIATRLRYRVNFDSWSSWTSVAGASPDPAPTTTTAYSLPGLPTARTLTGQFDPPQYQVDVEVEATLLDGMDEHDVQVRSFSYTTNADDV